MAPLSNAQRQAAYRQRLKDAAKVPPGDLEELTNRAPAVARAMPSLKSMVEAMPDGPDKDAARQHMEELRELSRLLKRLNKAIRDKKREGRTERSAG